MKRALTERQRPATGAHNLPLQVTSFISRDRELEELRGLLTTSRLLTLTGAGGCGKTRLAIELASGVTAAYPDGTWLVDLARISDPAFVERAVASTLAVPEAPGCTLSEGIIDALRSKSALVILDNCEHLVGVVAGLAAIVLQRCPGIRILATSREALAVAGEVTWRVPSLALPPWPAARQMKLEQLTEFAAVRLLIDRARAVHPGFTVTGENAPVLAEICIRLDGIPLAIELAAARLRIFTPEQILGRLDDRFRLLTTGPRTAMPRQQTLRALIDWSYALLSEPERTLLRRLSVFPGGWEIEGAEAVGAGDSIQHHAVLDLLGQLVDKSLVVVEQDSGTARYRLLETIRQYAREKLAESGDAEATWQRLFAYVLGLAEHPGAAMTGRDDPALFDRLEREHSNVRAALRWSLDAGLHEQALRLSSGLAWFWWRNGYFQEGWEWLEQALAGVPDRSAVRMKGLHGAGWLAHHQQKPVAARALLSESLAIARELGDRWTEAWVLHALGRVAYYDNDPATARTLGERSLAVAEEVGDPWLISWAVHVLGLAAYIAGDLVTARAWYERSLAIRRELQYSEGIHILLSLLGIIAFREGDLVRTRSLFREGLDIVITVGGGFPISMNLASFSTLAAAAGQPERAVRLAAASVRWRESGRAPLIPLTEELLTEALERARKELSEPAFAVAWAEGQSMTFEACIADMRAIEVEPSPPAPTDTVPAGSTVLAGLTPAELRVLRLLAGGLTTKEIAGELVIAVSTVDRHITHIFTKLGVTNRAAATAIAVKHGLV